MRFGIHSNKTRDLGYEVAQELASVMLSHGHVPVFREEGYCFGQDGRHRIRRLC